MSWAKRKWDYTMSPIILKKYCKTPLRYYPNSSATFTLSLICCGDVDPNPGPATNHDAGHDYRSTPKLERVYSPSQLHAARPNYQASIPASTWKIIRELGIRRKPATHRGCRAGRRKLKHFRNNIPTIITSSRSEGVKQHRNVVSVNHNNLVKIRTVDPNRNTSKIHYEPHGQNVSTVSQICLILVSNCLKISQFYLKHVSDKISQFGLNLRPFWHLLRANWDIF